MVHAEEKFTLREVHEERDKIVATALNFRVILFRDSIDAQVHLRAARHARGYFFAEKKVGMLAEDFRSLDRVMIGQGDDGHATLLTAVIDCGGLVVRLLAEPGKTRGVAHPGSGGVQMKIAAHGSMLDAGYEQSMKSAKNKHESWPGTH